MKTYTAEQLKEMLKLHRKWWDGREGGQRAHLSGADLSDAHLRGADLRGADLIGANLSDANLSDADLRGAKEDLFKILDAAPNEVKGLLDALNAGKVDGSTYSGECCCLVGTIANVRGCYYQNLDGITPDSYRPAERWFLAISRGNTPENSQVAKITAEWIEEWISLRPESIT